MVAQTTFTTAGQLQKAKEKARENGLAALKREHSLLFSESKIRNRIFQRVANRVEDECRYSIVYLGRGYWEITLHAKGHKHERELRKIADKMQPHHRYRVRIKVRRKQRNGR